MQALSYIIESSLDHVARTLCLLCVSQPFLHIVIEGDILPHSHTPSTNINYRRPRFSYHSVILI